MKNLVLFFAFLAFGLNASAQHADTDAEAKEQMSKLAFLVGDWKGNAWMMGRDGKRMDCTQTEDVEFKLDNTAILVEGKGVKDGKVVHDALAVITWNKDAQNYKFQSYLNSGRNGTFPAELKDGKLTWLLNETTRYVVHINDKGQWYETGETFREGKWMQFMEMTLEKDKD